jgi:hypothetical protein
LVAVFKVFFDFTVGFSRDLYFPAGTYQRVFSVIRETEKQLRIPIETYRGELRWGAWSGEHLDDDKYCDIAWDHNRMVERFYKNCTEATTYPTKKRPERITVNAAKRLFVGLRRIEIQPERWSAAHYQKKMQSIYKVMRGQESEGATFDSDPLTVSQARAVIILFSQFLDRHDIRLDVCKGDDWLTNSYDEGYFWCSGCGAVDYEDLPFRYPLDNDYCPDCSPAALGRLLLELGSTDV